MRFPTFSQAISATGDMLRVAGKTVHTETWQGLDVTKKPEMATKEIINHYLTIPTRIERLEELAFDIEPNLPWADTHFEERVSGQPLNPPPSWKTWPWGHSAEKFLKDGVFSHSYPERLWPKYAGIEDHTQVNCGIRFNYGDLASVVRMMSKLPLTRQAYVPIWFPEDTGAEHGERVPCTLGYHFLMRDNLLHVSYFIRSCDFRRHLRDDIYLTVRLQIWMLEQLRARNSMWDKVKPGDFSMWVGSLHVFVNDAIQMWGSP